MMYIFHTIQNKRMSYRGPALSMALLALFSPSATAIHGDDLLKCDTTATIADWSDEVRLTSLIDNLRNLKEDGLNPEVYPLPRLTSALEHLALWGSLSDCENQLAEHTYRRALLDLRFGRIDPLDQSIAWQSPLIPSPQRDAVLTRLLAGSDGSPSRAFELARPNHPEYRALREAYRQALLSYPSSWPVIDEGPTLSEGLKDTRVPYLKDRLRAQGYLQQRPEGHIDDPQMYDTATVGAVRKFQEDFNLIADGRAGKATVEALNRQPDELLGSLRANLERLRWPFNETLQRGLVIDIAGARATLYEQGQAIWNKRVQVGKPGRDTPQIRSLITHVTLHPAWNIPTSIFMENKLSRIRRDPGYLADQNIRVLDHSGNELPLEKVDWTYPASVRLQQQPGPSNPLGTIAVRFSNPYAVYLHDTPAGNLFESADRFYSHGCVRVEGAKTLAGMLFGRHDPSAREALDNGFANGETRNVHLPRSVPVLMTYRTAFVDDENTLRFHRDNYQQDRRLVSLLDQTEHTPFTATATATGRTVYHQ